MMDAASAATSIRRFGGSNITVFGGTAHTPTGSCHPRWASTVHQVIGAKTTLTAMVFSHPLSGLGEATWEGGD